MIKQSKVLEVKFEREFSNNYGSFYVHKISFENGDTGEYISQSKEQTKFIKGDLISYNMELKLNSNNEKYYKITPIKTDNTPVPKNPHTNFSRPLDTVGPMVGNAISNAIMLVCHSKLDINKIEETAYRLCEISIKLKNEFENKLKS